jgi:hypothetical protein
MQKELLEALIGQRKRLEIERDALNKDLVKLSGKSRNKILKSIKEIDSKIGNLKARISNIQKGREKSIGVIPPYV